MSGDEYSLTDLARIAAFSRRICALGAQIESVDGFDVLWRSHAHPFYRSVSIPNPASVHMPGAAQDRRALERLIAAFATRQMPVRLEFIDELHPALELLLDGAGWRLESRDILFAVRPAVATPSAGAPVVRLERLGGSPADSAQLEFLLGLARAFHASADRLDDEARELRAWIRADCASVAIALDKTNSSSALVGGAALCRLDDIAELQAVWTGAAWRGRGIATALCSMLIGDFFACGGQMAWLAASEPAATRLYRNLGFQPIGNYCRWLGPEDWERYCG